MILLLALLACGTTPSPPSAPEPRSATRSEARRPADAPPNIVVLLVDDAGYADFSLTGSPTMRTPAIDGIAAEGVTFDTAYVAAPICSPSRAALLTGRYPQRFGHEHNPPPSLAPRAGIPTTEVLLSDRLKQAGYATGLFGKWHLGAAPPYLPNARGFDAFEGVLRGERSYFPGEPEGLAAWRVDGDVVEETFPYVTDRIADASIAFMEAHQSEPFFALVAFTAVHTPLEAHPADLAVQPEALQGQRRTLGAMTTALDRAVGAIDRAIHDLGLEDDTLVFFLNDNGAGVRNAGDNSPFRGGKGRLWEGGVHVPFVVRWPGVAPAGQRRAAMVSSLDIVPTALAAARVPLPSGLDGLDLAGVLRGDTDAPHRAIHHWRLGTSWAIREGDLKLVVDKGADPALFDLATDPSESKDLAAARPDDVARLRALHHAWNAELVPPAFESNTSSRRRKRALKEAGEDDEEDG
ncbi:MAG: sulfatase-like hydrolase/transferase [Alphaproteobacteria bacterium]|nr:sulfatase-like hydrolase/transferase [Alphaproteobacteria bacterium]